MPHSFFSRTAVLAGLVAGTGVAAQAQTLTATQAKNQAAAIQQALDGARKAGKLGNCPNQMVNAAYYQMYRRVPTAAECNMANYGNGHTVLYADLMDQIPAYVAKEAAAAQSFAGVTINLGAGTLHDPSLGTVALKDVVFKDQLGNIMTPSQVASIVAQGGGNIVAQGGGNITGQRTLSSVGTAKRTYTLVKK